MKHIKTAILASLTLLSVSGQVFAAVEAQSQGAAEFVLSEAEFQKQRTFMLDDLAIKIKLLQTARTCAQKAKTPVEFSACTNNLQDGIRASAKPPADHAKSN